MPTVAWSTLRDEISRPLGFQDFTATTAINGDTLVVSTELSDRYPSDDHFNGWYLILENNANAGVVRRVQDYNREVTTPIGQITVRGAVLSDDSSNLAAGALHRFHPLDIRRAFNRARQDVFPEIGIVRDHQLLVTSSDQTLYTIPSTVRRIQRVYLGNRLLAKSVLGNIYQDNNPDLESWTNATTPADWTISGSGGTANQEQETSGPHNYAVLSGSNSARIVVTTNEVTFLHDSPTLNVATEGLEVNVAVWVYSRTASRVSARIEGTAVTDGSGTAHSGGGWERLTHTLNTGPDGGTITAGILITGSSAMSCYVDNVVAIIGPSEALEGDWDPVLNYEFIPPVGGASSGGSLYLSAPLQEKQVLRVVGTDTLSSVSADTDTVEIDRDVLEPLYNKTREYLVAERAGAFGYGTDGYMEWKSKEAEYRALYDQWVRGRARSLAPMPAPKAPYIRVA